MDWREFWDGDHSIYVNGRHRRLHADLVARGVAALIPSRDAVVLDWGCGEALAAPTLAARCRRLFLYDAAPRVRESARARYAGDERIAVLDEEGFAALGEDSLDCVAIVSVAQYLSREAFIDALDDLRPKLRAGGRLIVADVIPPDLSPLVDARALLAFGWRGGFLFAALAGLAKTFFSNYRTLREKLGLTQWSEDAMVAVLAAHGFRATRAAENVGHNPARMTFVAVRA